MTSFVAVMLASGGAASQESNARPEAAVVERWTYQAHDRQFDEGAFTIEVSEKTSTGYVLSSKDVTTKTLSLIPSGLTLDLNWLQAAADGPAANCKMSQMTVGAVVAYVVYRLVKRGERLGNLRSGYPDEIRGILARGPVKQSRVIEWLWTTSIKGKVSGRSISASLKWSESPGIPEISHESLHAIVAAERAAGQPRTLTMTTSESKLKSHTSPSHAQRSPRRKGPRLTALAALTVASLVGCGGGGDDGAPTRDYLLASGRWDNTAIVIDVAKAIDPANDGTPNAVINRLRVTPDVDATGTGKLDTPASGQPINVVIAPDNRRAYVVNHSGRATPAQSASFQHGWPGTVTVVDLTKALDPANNNTLNAVEAFIDSQNFGATGFAISPDQKYAAHASSEGPGTEDGARYLGIVDLTRNLVVRQVELAFGKPGFPCPPTPIPRAGPDPFIGCFTATNGVTISPLGGGTIFTANGGTNDVSVISLQKAIAGEAGAELGRIPTQTGGFGISTSPDGKLVALAARENQATGKEGNTISLIDVEKALANPALGEVARVMLGTDDPTVGTRPFAAAFTPDGKRIVVTHFRTNNISIVDVDKALAGQPSELKRIALVSPAGQPSRPRGIAFTSDGKHVAITGVPRGAASSGVVWMVNMDTYAVVSRVTQVGNESYFIGKFQGK